MGPKIRKLLSWSGANARIIFLGSAVFIVAAHAVTYPMARKMEQLYRNQPSVIVTDRRGREIIITPNVKGHYARVEEKIPPRFKELLIRKEDRLFKYHLGVNPYSIARDGLGYLTRGRLKGSSTITQQLAKILLGNENQRNLKNKLKELVYALALELHASKEEILNMYANSAYFGNRAEGLGQASRFYFNLPPELLGDSQILELLAALNSPTEGYPGRLSNRRRAAGLGQAFGLDIKDEDFTKQTAIEAKESFKAEVETPFEIKSLGIKFQASSALTIDQELTAKLRQVLKKNLELPSFATAQNGAIAVIKIGAGEEPNELLALVGSPNPELDDKGFKTNMAIKPRPIGSTAKPLIYAKAFERGARPYTLVEDREYKYAIGTGFAFYPKNFDGQYRGTVTLHQALANSLNVPSVKTLEYAGLENFYKFLGEDLGFKPIQPLESYGLGIALGGLEMDLLTLGNYFTIFANEGRLKPLKIRSGADEPLLVPPQSSGVKQPKRVIAPEFVELVNKILTDRETGIDQFGLKSNLNLAQGVYAVKTGTSRDFHDSWSIGYTPDFVVGVWIGNSDNTPMHQFSGQAGAGKVWHEAMDILLNSPYNLKTDFVFKAIKEFRESGTTEYGLAGDDYRAVRGIMSEKKLITSPHDGDAFLFESGIVIPLEAREAVRWTVSPVRTDASRTPDGSIMPSSVDPIIPGSSRQRSNGVNGTASGEDKKISWKPPRTGTYRISATPKLGEEQEIFVEVRDEE